VFRVPVGGRCSKRGNDLFTCEVEAIKTLRRNEERHTDGVTDSVFSNNVELL
jgi:hypothetical protein